MFLKKLEDIMNNSKTTYTIDELLGQFQSDIIIVCIVCLTIITSLPLPPWGGGFETIPGGVLCIFLSLQGILGFNQVYLPEYIKNIEVDIENLKSSTFLQDSIKWANDNIETNRYEWVFNVFTEKIMYLLIMLHAILMIIPVIFTNGPPSQCITLMGLFWLLKNGFYFLIILGFSIFILAMYMLLFVFSAKYLYKIIRYYRNNR